MAFAANHFGNTSWLIPGYRIGKRRIYTENIEIAKREAFLYIQSPTNMYGDDDNDA